MNPSSYVKLTKELAEDIRARVKSLDFGAIEKISKAKENNGTFDVIISTEDLDRAGEIVRQNGWEMANYKNNPIVLWGHDYYSLPIGVCTETYETEYHGMKATGAKGVFYPAEINPFAQQVRAMYDFGIKSGYPVGCTTSVGFIPKEFDESNQRIITRAELLEFSFVPVPGQPGRRARPRPLDHLRGSPRRSASTSRSCAARASRSSTPSATCRRTSARSARLRPSPGRSRSSASSPRRAGKTSPTPTSARSPGISHTARTTRPKPTRT